MGWAKIPGTNKEQYTDDQGRVTATQELDGKATAAPPTAAPAQAAAAPEPAASTPTPGLAPNAVTATPLALTGGENAARDSVVAGFADAALQDSGGAGPFLPPTGNGLNGRLGVRSAPMLQGLRAAGVRY